jgi:hypothetical protein
MHLTRGIDGQGEVGTHGTHRLDMVGMVVGHQHVVNLLQVHTILLAVLAQTSQAYADIYDEGIGFCGQIVAITTAATTERYEFQHLFSKISAKVINNSQFSLLNSQFFTYLCKDFLDI